MSTIWERFLQTRFTCTRGVLQDKGQNIWKGSLFSKKATLTIK